MFGRNLACDLQIAKGGSARQWKIHLSFEEGAGSSSGLSAGLFMEQCKHKIYQNLNSQIILDESK